MFYRFVVFVCKIIFAVLYGIRITGSENIPQKGSAIICSNHINLQDPVTICISTKRAVHFMGKKELFQNKLLGAFFRAINAFPVDRQSGRDIEAMRKAVDLLKNNNVLGIFFQGRRIKNGDEKAAKSGVALFALKTGAPVIPTYISGEYKFLKKMTIKFGEPIFFDEYSGQRVNQELLDKLTNIISEKVGALAN